MNNNKNGILNRAKAAQQTAAVMDEGLRAYMLKVYNYMGNRYIANWNNSTNNI